MNDTITIATATPLTSTEIHRGLASLVLTELPVSLDGRGWCEHTELTDRIRVLVLDVCSTYGLDYPQIGPAIIEHVLEHLAGYLPGLEAPEPHHQLPKEPCCDPVRAWIVNRLGDACEQYPEVVIPVLRRAAEDYQPVLENTDA